MKINYGYFNKEVDSEIAVVIFFLLLIGIVLSSAPTVPWSVSSSNRIVLA